jgi:hypothetical protein
VQHEGRLVPRFAYQGHVEAAPPDDGPDSPAQRVGLVRWLKNTF